MIIVRESIRRVLEGLEEQSSLERSRRVDVRPEDRMLAITRDTGEMINMMLRVMRARNVLEVGMSVGYSTIWCAEAVMENRGRVTTIERSPGKIERARKNFEAAGVSESIQIRQGMAINILAEMGSDQGFSGLFDFALIDADKENVIEYFDLILPMISAGGVIMTDNMLYPERYRDHMRRLSDHIRSNPALRTITSPLGNGEEITIKLRPV